MGQKVHPISFRLGFNQTWRSRWFRRQLGPAVVEDFRIRAHVMKRFPRAGISQIQIERKEEQIRLIIYTARPGVIIGRAGQGTKDIASELLKRGFIGNRARLEIEIREVKQPEIVASLVADSIGNAIERRLPAKRVMRQAVSKALDKGAKGIKIQVSGRIGGAEIARRDRVMAGSIPLSTLRSDIDYALYHAKTSWGTIGIKVWIYLGDKDRGEE